MKVRAFGIAFGVTLVLLVVGSYGYCEENFWSTGGPQGGSVHAIAFHPSDNRIIYIGTIENGIYKTTDGGQSWEQLPLGNLPRTLRVIQIHPTAPDTMYASTVNGMFKSSDAGMTWNLLTPPRYVHEEYRAFVMHPCYPNILFGGYIAGFKSTDSGATWTELALPQLTDFETFAIDPVNPDNIYFVGGNMPIGNGVWKSTDLGEIWFSIQNNMDSVGAGVDMAVDPVNNSILYVAVSDPGRESGRCLWKSVNGGNDWTDITPDSLALPIITRVRVSPVEHNTVYTIAVYDGLLKSTDGGQTWQRKNNGLRMLRPAAVELDSTNGVLYLGNFYDGIYRSSDGGDNWEPISSNINDADCWDATVSPRVPNLFFAASVSGLYWSFNAGEDWEYVDLAQLPVPFVSSVRFDRYLPENIYVSTYGKNRGPGYSPGFWLSTDEGASWQFRSNGLPDSSGYLDINTSYISPSDRRIFLASHGGIYYSDDLGDSWNACQQGLPYGPYWVLDVAPGDANVLGASDSYNHFFLSIDRGMTWSQTTDPPRVGDGLIYDMEFHPLDSRHIYVTSLFSGIFESTDEGQSWRSILNDLPIDPEHPQYPVLGSIAINPYNPSNIFVVSNNMGVYQSHDGGTHWHAFNAGLDTALAFGYRLYFFPGDTTRLILSTVSRSVWSIHRTITGVADDEPVMPADITLSAYPNPFNGTTVISIVGMKEANIGIYDIAGRRMATLRTENGRAAWDAVGVSSGVYFARLERSTKATTIKMVLLR